MVFVSLSDNPNQLVTNITQLSLYLILQLSMIIPIIFSLIDRTTYFDQNIRVMCWTLHLWTILIQYWPIIINTRLSFYFLKQSLIKQSIQIKNTRIYVMFTSTSFLLMFFNAQISIVEIYLRNGNHTQSYSKSFIHKATKRILFQLLYQSNDNRNLSSTFLFSETLLGTRQSYSW